MSDEYPCAGVSVIFSLFLHNFVLAQLATSSIRIKDKKLTMNTMMPMIVLTMMRTAAVSPVNSEPITPPAD